MRQELIDHSQDLKRLRDEGFGIQEKGGLLIVHHIPYLNSKKEILYGKLVCELSLNGTNGAAKPKTHIMHFCGDYPCNTDGTEISVLRHQNRTYEIVDGITVNFSFSTKINGGRDYNDYYEKVCTYSTIISGPAKAINNTVSEKSFVLYEEESEDTVFVYCDTNSSRANITQISAKLKGQRIAIVGTGGTGSYILDFIAKTPVAEIHLYDKDKFYVHNAFRAPGAATRSELDSGLEKVVYFANKYSAMHKRVIPHCTNITEDNVHELINNTFVFIAIDKGGIKALIIKTLLEAGVPFIDVGMGIEAVNDFLIGILRVTIGTSDKSDHLQKRISFVDDDEDDYHSNIQIAELNALNASLAIIKWKKYLGFYHDMEKEFHSTYTISESQLLNDEIKD